MNTAWPQCKSAYSPYSTYCTSFENSHCSSFISYGTSCMKEIYETSRHLSLDLLKQMEITQHTCARSAVVFKSIPIETVARVTSRVINAYLLTSVVTEAFIDVCENTRQSSVNLIMVYFGYHTNSFLSLS